MRTRYPLLCEEWSERNGSLFPSIVRDPNLCKKALENVIEALTPSTVGTALGSMFDFAKLGFSA